MRSSPTTPCDGPPVPPSDVVDRGRVAILGCEIDALDMEATLARCEELIRAGGYAQHVAINAAKVVKLHDDAELAAIVRECTLVNADGQSIVWASRLLRRPLPERVAGIDLMHRLLALAEDRGYRVFVLGARAATLEQAVERINAQHPRLVWAGWRDGYFDDAQAGAVCEQIRRSQADILFVAMSSPQKEYFLGAHGRALGVPFVMGVGGAIDVVAGVTRRAPVLWQRLGLEWLYRLLQEPRRMFRRYAVTNARFTWMVARSMVSRGP